MTMTKNKKLLVGAGVGVALLLAWRRFRQPSVASNARLNLQVGIKQATLTNGGGGMVAAGSLSGTTLSGNALTSYGPKGRRSGSLS